MPTITYINCKACGNEKTMEPSKINKMSPIVVFIGWIIVIPSALMTSIFFISFITSTIALKSTGQLSSPVSVIFLVFAVICLVSGTIGYILISKKKVFKCRLCCAIIDRA